MRLHHVTSIALLLAIHGVASRQVQGGGFAVEPQPSDELVAEGPYEPVRLPLSAKSARAWIALRETMVKPLPAQTPLGEVIQALKATTAGKKENPAPLAFYIDPVALQEAELTMASPVDSPFVGDVEVPLYTYLTLLLEPLGLAPRVHDGLIVIDQPCDDCPSKVEVSAAEAWAWLLLQEEASLRFPSETPLEAMLKAIQRTTVGKGPGGRSLVIHIDPIGLNHAEKTLNSPVSIELDQIPLCTALGLILQQLGMGFRVGEDGVVRITDDLDFDLMDEANVIEEYQQLRYELFWERKRHETKPASPSGDRQGQGRSRPQPSKPKPRVAAENQ